VTRTTVVTAPNPSVFTGPGTNTYLVGDGDELFCIDPGPEDEGHLEAVLTAASQCDARIGLILLTHSHPDHRPLAAMLSARTGAAVRSFDITAGSDAAQPLRDGERVRLGDTELTAVHTPGHARDHLCFHDEHERALYTGDHVLTGMTSFVDPDDGDMRLYMESLQRVLALRPRVIHPGHGPRSDDGTALIRQYIAHRLEREEQIVVALRGRGPRTPMELVVEIYSAYPAVLHPLAARTVQAHLDKLVHDGLAARSGDGSEPRYTLL
jgi:glyoxylase-like metal-dependent hydrolase (beta-lactamase superfamily II)